MSNLNISIDLTKLPGAKVMNIEGNKSTKTCVVIPIDNVKGTVCDAYKGKGSDGMPEWKSFKDVKLNLTAIEHRKKKHGISHGIKPSFSREVMERMTEEQIYNTPWMGTIKPWALDAETDDIGDLPEGNNENDW